MTPGKVKNKHFKINFVFENVPIAAEKSAKISNEYNGEF